MEINSLLGTSYLLHERIHLFCKFNLKLLSSLLLIGTSAGTLDGK